MSAHPPDTGLPASDGETALLLERAAVQQAKVGAATKHLNDTKLRRAEIDQTRAEAEERFQTARKAHSEAQSAYYRALEVWGRDVLSANKMLDAAVQEMKVVRAPFHPIRRAPLEVLGLVFASCLDVDVSQYRQDPFPVQVFRLASVCRLWRRAALAHPRIWTNIDVSLDRIRTKDVAVWKRYLSLLVACSGNAPLRIRFIRERPMMSLDMQIARALLPYLPRCVFLFVFLQRVGEKDGAVRFLNAPFPILRDLRLTLPDSHEAPSVMLPHAPLLQRMEIRYPFAGMSIPLSRLAEVTLFKCTMDEVVALLDTVTGLETLHIDSLLGGDLRLRQTKLHSSITTLSFRYCFPREFHFLARNVRFPALSRLVCDEPLDYVTDYFSTVVTSLPALKRLSLVSTLIYKENERHLISALSRCQTLERIDFTKTRIVNVCDFLGKVWDTCPSLSVLDMTGCWLQDTKEEVQRLMELVATRRAAVDSNPQAGREKPITRHVGLTELRLPPAFDADAASKIAALLSGER
ncbi:hypothetical protein EXIGLDRAFT_718531 [Exidia glandulosa HHB12029]|uniref:Uncharacterized protein n=1 Tax=Exidia glandulosa HHB12029 TaxID=1314781 RepID=A0A165NZE3_EXIGL|nr:hypothetical protein EXIGLDRAFT_718531 [Exidia glandulosa HHB12029]